MQLGKLLFKVIILISILALAACGGGGDSETNGTIDLSLDSTATGISTYNVNATATFSKVVANVPITFYWKMKSPSDLLGASPGNFGDVTKDTLSNGVATHPFSVIQTTENISFEVYAKYGNVYSGTKVVEIPAITP